MLILVTGTRYSKSLTITAEKLLILVIGTRYIKSVPAKKLLILVTGNLSPL